MVSLMSGDNIQQTSKWVGCFTCQGSHQVRDYPKREKVFVLQ